MNRAALFLVVILGLSGCSSPARYIERSGDTGVVAIPANTDTFPTYNRSEAVALIQKHVGPTSRSSRNARSRSAAHVNDQQVNNEQTWNSTNPILPANKQTVQNATTTQDVNEYRIMYRKKAPVAQTPAMEAPITPPSLQPQAPITGRPTRRKADGWDRAWPSLPAARFHRSVPVSCLRLGANRCRAGVYGLASGVIGDAELTRTVAATAGAAFDSHSRVPA